MQSNSFFYFFFFFLFYLFTAPDRFNSFFFSPPSVLKVIQFSFFFFLFRVIIAWRRKLSTRVRIFRTAINFPAYTRVGGGGGKGVGAERSFDEF